MELFVFGIMDSHHEAVKGKLGLVPSTRINLSKKPPFINLSHYLIVVTCTFKKISLRNLF